jgi:hypothetical protein
VRGSACRIERLLPNLQDFALGTTNDDLAGSKPNMTAITRLMSNRMSVVTITANLNISNASKLGL